MKFLLNCKNSKKGFTLIEILTVVVVLGILACIAIPVYSTTVKKMNRRFCQMEQQSLVQYVQKYMLGSYDGQKHEYLVAQAHLVGVSEADCENFKYIPDGDGGTKLNPAYKETKRTSLWGCGSYDPDTKTWYGGLFDNSNGTKFSFDGDSTAWSYYYYDKDAEEWVDYSCSCEGERFLRYAYDIHPDDPLEFKSMEDGCSLYITLNGKIVTVHCSEEFHEKEEPYSCINY